MDIIDEQQQHHQTDDSVDIDEVRQPHELRQRHRPTTTPPQPSQASQPPEQHDEVDISMIDEEEDASITWKRNIFKSIMTLLVFLTLHLIVYHNIIRPMFTVNVPTQEELIEQLRESLRKEQMQQTILTTNQRAF
mgnify:CR=1 FL=1